jgi:hypothetical protein
MMAMNKIHFEHYATLAPEIVATAFPLASLRESSEPSPGSPCYDTRALNIQEIMNRKERIIEHRDGNITVVTDVGWVKFWKDNRRPK